MKLVKLALLGLSLCASGGLLDPQVHSGGRLTGNVTVEITSPTVLPTYDAGGASTVALAGTATSDRPIAGCNYVNDLGGSGAASGTNSWSIASVALTVGTNTITVTCTNDTGVAAQDAIIVTRSTASAGTAHLWVDRVATSAGCVDNVIPVVYDAATACGFDQAADLADAGDTVRVKAGNYATRLTPGADGTSGSPITFVPDGGTVQFCGMDLNVTRSYNRFIGFLMDTDTLCAESSGVITIGGGVTITGFEFWHNTIRDADRGGIRIGATDRTHNWVIVGNTFSNFGIGNGSGMAVALRGDNNFVAYNEISNVHPDCFLAVGSGSRWLNNYTHDQSEASGGHIDVFQSGSNPLGLSNILIESNFQVAIGTAGDEHVSNISNGQACPCGAMSGFVLRNNVWHNNSGGTWAQNAATSGDISFSYYYHNTEVDAQREAGSTNNEASIFYLTAGVHDSYFFNNIHYNTWGDGSSTTEAITVWVLDGPNSTMNYNLAFDPDVTLTFASIWTNQANERSNINPQFVDYVNKDFTLGATSGAIDFAGPLTMTSGTGNGTTFNTVSNGAGFFRGANTSISQYGGALAPGDVITVGTDLCTISSISGDAITCAETIAWANAEPVYFGTDTLPDIGAFPRKAGGYTLSATYIKSGSTVTTTPNDTSLVRFVACFEDGIQTTIDNTSPYTCTVGNGALVVRVYKRYASRAPLWVDATQQ